MSLYQSVSSQGGIGVGRGGCLPYILRLVLASRTQQNGRSRCEIGVLGTGVGGVLHDLDTIMLANRDTQKQQRTEPHAMAWRGNGKT